MIAFGELYGYSTEILSPFLVMLFLIPTISIVFLVPGLSEAGSTKAKLITSIIYSLIVYTVSFTIVFISGYLITGAMPHNVEILKVYSQSNESNFIQVEKLEGCSVKVTSSEESEVELINGNAVERRLVEVDGKEVFSKVQFFKKGESKIYSFKGIYDCYLTAP